MSEKHTKGQKISEGNCAALNFQKKITKKFHWFLLKSGCVKKIKALLKVCTN